MWTGRAPPSLTLFGPGGSVEFECHVEAPAHGGVAELVLDIVAEGDRWFGLDVSSPIEIGPSAREQLLSQLHGGMIPLAAALESRRLLGHPDELLRQLSNPDPDVALSAEVRDAFADLVQRGVDGGPGDGLDGRHVVR